MTTCNNWQPPREPVATTNRQRPGPRRKQLLALTVAIALPLMKISRALGEENDVGYRKGYYREDDGRMRISTDTWQFNLGIKDNIRVNGEVIVDGISGATPNGAPPQTQWPINTFSQSYSQNYGQNYGQLFINEVNDPANQTLYTAGLFGAVGDPAAYQAYTNYVATLNPAQLANQASNAVYTAYNSLTNHPNYHHNKVPLAEMHDHRNAFSIQMPMTFGLHSITPSFAYSAESDYISFGGALNYSLALNDKNTTLSAGWGHNSDSVRDDLGIWENKMTDNAFLGLVQLFGPKAYLTVNASVGFEHGYLADPYREVFFANVPQSSFDDPQGNGNPEVRPRHRNNQILYTSWTQFVTPLNGSFELSYRFFHDSYGIFAHTAELDWHQKIGKHLVISPTFRYYVQNAADFYYVMVPDVNHPPSFYSSDYRLSQMETVATGVSLTWRVQKHLSLDVSYLRYVMQGLDGVTSQSAYPAANLVSFGARIWF